MKWRNITVKQLRKLVRKISLEPSKSKRRAPEPVFWYYVNGKKVDRIYHFFPHPETFQTPASSRPHAHQIENCNIHRGARVDALLITLAANELWPNMPEA